MFISMSYWKIAAILACSWVAITLLSIPNRLDKYDPEELKLERAKSFVKIANEVFYYILALPVAYFLHFAIVLWIIRIFAIQCIVIGLITTIVSIKLEYPLFIIADLIFIACSVLMFAAI